MPVPIVIIVIVIVSLGFNLIESASDVDFQETDITGIDPGFSAATLVDNQVLIDVDDESAVLHAGQVAYSGALAIDGTGIGVAPHIGGFTQTAQNGFVFWSSDSSGNIYRSDEDFRFTQKIVDTSSAPLDIEVDADNSRVYWLQEDTGGNKSIMSVRLDGSGQSLERNIDNNATEFTIGGTSSEFYVVSSDESGAGSNFSNILRYESTNIAFDSDLDERQGELVHSSASNVSVTALEMNNSKDTLYWGEFASDSPGLEIKSLDISVDGADIHVSVDEASIVDAPNTIAVVTGTDQLFWTIPGQQSLARYDDVSGVQLQDESPYVPQAIEYDELNSRLVWADQLDVFWTNAEFENSGLVGTASVSVDHMAYTRIMTLLPGELSINEQSQISVAEGGEISLNNASLQVSDENTDDTDILFTVVEQHGGTVLVNEVPIVSVPGEHDFTLAQLKTADTIKFKHNDDEPSVPTYINLAVSDGDISLDIPRINIDVTPVNDNAPVAQDHQTTGKHGTSLTTIASGTQSSLLFNLADADEPADVFQASVVSGTSSGTLALEPDGTFSYVAPDGIPIDEDYTDAFTYKVTDSAGNESVFATVEIYVQALQAPYITSPIEDQSAEELQMFSYPIPESVFASLMMLISNL